MDKNKLIGIVVGFVLFILILFSGTNNFQESKYRGNVVDCVSSECGGSCTSGVVI